MRKYSPSPCSRTVRLAMKRVTFYLSISCLNLLGGRISTSKEGRFEHLYPVANVYYHPHTALPCLPHYQRHRYCIDFPLLRAFHTVQLPNNNTLPFDRIGHRNSCDSRHDVLGAGSITMCIRFIFAKMYMQESSSRGPA